MKKVKEHKWLNLAYAVFPMCVTLLSMTGFLKKHCTAAVVTYKLYAINCC